MLYTYVHGHGYRRRKHCTRTRARMRTGIGTAICTDIVHRHVCRRAYSHVYIHGTPPQTTMPQTAKIEATEFQPMLSHGCDPAQKRREKRVLVANTIQTVLFFGIEVRRTFLQRSNFEEARPRELLRVTPCKPGLGSSELRRRQKGMFHENTTPKE